MNRMLFNMGGWRRLAHRRYLRVLIAVAILSPLIVYCLRSSTISSVKELGKNQWLQRVDAGVPKIYDSTSGKGNDVLLTLVRNSELTDMIDTIERFERSFNSKYHYQWWFMNDEEFTEEFKEQVSTRVSGGARFIKIPDEMWTYPGNIDKEKAAASREDYAKKKVMYGESESYRFMCRFNSGLFYKLDELRDIEYYWRIEPGVHFDCQITYDVFQYMRKNNKLYAFNMALQEDVRTIPSLWNTTMEFFQKTPQYIADKNNAKFVTDDDGSSYNLCHFWSNFEIANLRFYRSDAYEQYFQHLDNKGGFFYERWGDAPVHTLAASFMLPADSLHFVANTGYMHNPNQDCPVDEEVKQLLHCDCNSRKDFTWHKWSCVSKFFDVNNYPRPTSVANLKKYYPYVFENI
ncbi:hypothetical protein HG537_0A04460 [Torulaspora globosa]|uniref:Glycosyltransferase family 15 protein n=1 Tax=Torulaspora globosa TaxID=48254 RepID=A0A7H9HLK4_9SACH|nr:hypothetical protein HG537_0A04460 [Torulaspora sp. CBS 2947]